MVVELPYSLHTRYASIAIAWTVIIIPPTLLNIGLFYSLWFGTKLDKISALTIPTAILGVFTAIATVERVLKLVRHSSEYRPLNSPRYALDIFQWGYFLVLIIISSLITSALAREDRDHDDHDFQIRLMSLPTCVLMYAVATLGVLSLALNYFDWKLPFRFGSVGPGNAVRPAIYYIVEDIVAVDGFGGVEYRKAFVGRYDSSPIFRRMIWDLTLIWTLYFYVFAILFTILVIVVLPKPAVYAVGWAGPFPLAGLMVLWTIAHVRSTLKLERAEAVAPDDETTRLLRQ